MFCLREQTGFVIQPLSCHAPNKAAVQQKVPMPHDVGDFLEVVVQLAQSFRGLGVPVLCVLPERPQVP